MSEAIEQPDAVVEQSTAAPAPDTWSEVDALLNEFAAKTGVADSSPEQATDGNPPTVDTSADQTLDQQIAELLGPDPKVAELQGQVDAFKASEFQAQERRAAEAWAAELQDVVSRSNPNVENDFVIREIKVLSADNPGVLEQAWQYRNLSDADLAIAQRDFQAAEKLYQQALAQPDTPQKQQALRYLEQQGARLQAMLTSRSVIRSARNEIRKRADAVKSGYDPDVTATRMELAQLIRDGGSGREPPPTPQPKLGELDTQEYRRHVRETYGFDPNV
jgi:hypothetical protein